MRRAIFSRARITSFRERGAGYRRSEDVHRQRLYRPGGTLALLCAAGFRVAPAGATARRRLAAGATCTWLASRISATGVSESQDLAALGRDAGRVVRSTGIISAMASEAANELLRSGREALAAAD
jgi:hypothetical protein